MSPTPPRRKFWLIGVGIVVVATTAVMTVLRYSHGSDHVAELPGSAPEEPVLPPAMPRQITSQLAPRPQVIAPDLARAVAAVGAYEDGRRATLDDVAESVRALFDQARLLLAGTSRIAAPGLPMRLPDGREMRLPPDPPRRGDPTTPTVPIPGSPAAREQARAVDGRLIARSHSIDGKLPAPTRGDVVKEILEPDAWFSVPYDPAMTKGQMLEITNRSLGEYALRLEASDYGSVRLNGGLVVPGRYYQVNGTMTVTSDVPVGVVVRPLGVVPSYFAQPVRPPSANG
jgi:hypothetical protein